MDLLEVLKGILEGRKGEALPMADWLYDTHSEHPEFARYHKLLARPDTLRLQTVVDVVIKFGTKKERSAMTKIIRKIKRAKNRGMSKGVLQAYMGKSWSLQRPWFMAEKIKEALGCGASALGSEER